MWTDRYALEPERLDWDITYLTEKHKQMYGACSKYKKELAPMHFDFIATNYEGMYNHMGYPDPKYVANYVMQFAKKNDWKPSDVKVLDLACGTGLIGKYLAGHGFKNIYGLDLSPGMLNEAANKGVYKELDEHTLGNPEEFPEKFKN